MIKHHNIFTYKDVFFLKHYSLYLSLVSDKKDKINISVIPLDVNISISRGNTKSKVLYLPFICVECKNILRFYTDSEEFIIPVISSDSKFYQFDKDRVCDYAEVLSRQCLPKGGVEHTWNSTLKFIKELCTDEYYKDMSTSYYISTDEPKQGFFGLTIKIHDIIDCNNTVITKQQYTELEHNIKKFIKEFGIVNSYYKERKIKK